MHYNGEDKYRLNLHPISLITLHFALFCQEVSKNMYTAMELTVISSRMKRETYLVPLKLQIYEKCNKEFNIAIALVLVFFVQPDALNYLVNLFCDK